MKELLLNIAVNLLLMKLQCLMYDKAVDMNVPVMWVKTMCRQSHEMEEETEDTIRVIHRRNKEALPLQMI